MIVSGQLCVCVCFLTISRIKESVYQEGIEVKCGGFLNFSSIW